MENIHYKRLTLLSIPFKEKVIAQCECGTIKSYFFNNIRRGLTTSCGCYFKEQLSKRVTTHGGRHLCEYKIWEAMKRRCSNPKAQSYKYYGARGIKVCKRWVHSFANFLIDLGHRPNSLYSIDRINVNGDYTPTNCQWATAKQQRLNRRDSIG